MARITKPTRRWFEMEGDEDGARVEIKALAPGERQEVAQAALKQRLIYKPGEDMQTVQEINPSGETLAMARLCVVGWENFFDESGKPMKCTRKNIERAVKMIEGFAVFGSQSLKKLTEDIAAEKEEQEKNS